ncbi:hydroxymethylbilane synthase [Succinispira mobilis]|uniref:hydroxymethylbilane synthase n=1 Tax=Succinispira mobilis TaxID=78120 RepID=UPI000364E114|nr:hydroxymethylbilane synthase [Succinispira mobilis]
MKKKLTIGTRQSALALWQAEHIAALLQEKYPECEIALKRVLTKGDKILDVSLSKIGGKGLFTKEIEQDLLAGEVDLAVHSLKDMPTELPEGLILACITKREHEGDAFVSNNYKSLAELPLGATVGTSSLRRKAQLLAARPDLQIVDLRGNVQTRLARLDEGKMQAIILAVAGLRRLGLGDRIQEILPHAICLPAVGQGALAIEARANDSEVLQMLEFLNDPDTQAVTKAERAYLRLLEGGCQVPIGVYAEVCEQQILLRAVIASLDGQRVLKDCIQGAIDEAEQLGIKLGEQMLAAGGREILAEIM